MRSPLDSIRLHVDTPADAIRWACVLEATAPKAGNVFPGRSFADLAHIDFMHAAEIAAKGLTEPALGMGRRILTAVRETRQITGTNTNLGIALLLGPLVAAEPPPAVSEREPMHSLDQQAVLTDWQARVADRLRQLSVRDSRDMFAAIASASAGGLGKVETMDVHQPGADHDDIITAMRLATSNDRIAVQYAGDFTDFFDKVVPQLNDSIQRCGDVLGGIAEAHVRLLVANPDSLIARKCGPTVAAEVQQLAANVDLNDLASVRAFDQCLRVSDHRLNPGTTADLIAAALYVLLRLPIQVTSDSHSPSGVMRQRSNE